LPDFKLTLIREDTVKI